MELRLEGGVARVWRFGRRQMVLNASLQLPDFSQRDSSRGRLEADVGEDVSNPSSEKVLQIWSSLYEAFTKVISPSLVLGDHLLGDELHLLAVLSGEQAKGSAKHLRLRNLRGQIDSNQKLPLEVLFLLGGTLQLGDTDPEDEESGPRHEEYSLKVETHFETFRNGGGIEYGLEYKPQFPGVLRNQGTDFLRDPQLKNQIREFRFAWDRFASTSFGMSLGFVPRVLQRTQWFFRGNTIGLIFSRELESGERASALGGLADIVEFGRAIEALGLCDNFTKRCTDYLESKMGT